MKISLNWLKTLIPLELSPEKIEAILTATGLEVEHFERVGSIKGGLLGLIVGEVVECAKHPNANKLSLTKVDIGSDKLLSIVCGAPNVAAGLKVIVAPVGTTVYPIGAEPFTIQKAKIRGEASEGMLCAEDEIGLGVGHQGLMLLPPETSIGKKVSDVLKIESDVLFEIGLTANRGDAASHVGVARELATVLEIPFQIPQTNLEHVSINHHIKIDVQDQVACPRYCGIVLQGLQIKESPDWLKNRLSSIGLRPINIVVDITNFIMHDLGQPLHAFDFNAIKGEKIVVRRAQKEEKFTTLDGTERTLLGNELMICNETEAMCMAGVYGGIGSGVSSATTSVFLESAYFSPDVVRKSAKQHALNTDSSFRFERGTDPEMCIEALKKAAAMLIEYAGARVVTDIMDVYPEKLQPFSIKLRGEMIQKITGIEIPEAKIESILIGLGITIASKSGKDYALQVPRFKSDVTREIDVIEELIRIYGFSHIPLQKRLNMSLNYSTGNVLRTAERKITDLLSANGFREIMNNSLSTDNYYENKDSLVYISNPLSAEMNVMRSSMLYTALESIAYNKNRKQSNTRFFEFGKVYQQKEKGFKETDQLLIIASGNQSDESWESKSVQVDPFYIKSIAHKVGDAFHAKLKDDTIVEVEASVLNTFGIKDKVFYTVIEWTKLAKQKVKFELKPIPQFPVVRRDLSLVLEKEIRYQELENIIEKKGGGKIYSCNVFDVYEGKPMEENQKAVSISIELYDDTKTMSDSDIDPIMNELIKTFESELNALIRK